MNFEKGYIYHIFNQGNNHRNIFFNRENYLFFLRKINTYVSPYADILAWCLMPNHFHLMVLIREVKLSVEIDTMTQSHRINKKVRTINNSIAIMIRSYTRAINIEQNLSGSLFKAHTKAECVNCPNGIMPSFIAKSHTMTSSHRMTFKNPEKQYPQICFNYIHKNPTKAKLVTKDTDWEFSSAKDYAGLRNGKLVNINVAEEYLNI